VQEQFPLLPAPACCSQMWHKECPRKAGTTANTCIARPLGCYALTITPHTVLSASKRSPTEKHIDLFTHAWRDGCPLD
jgi:hypothetical protein